MIEFAKAHACGNDFLIVERQQIHATNLAPLSRALCARTTGVGADGVEFLTLINEREGRIRLHNADGSVAEISGNGTRCVAAWMARRAGLAAGSDIHLETDAGMRVCRLERVRGSESLIVTGMGVPTVAQRTVRLADGSSVVGAAVSTGNPHFVVMAEAESFTVAGRPWQELGAELCTHPDFPGNTNVEFVRRVTSDAIEIRIFERGVGPTSSSGTGTSASAAAMIALHGAAKRLLVRAPGGEQTVEWSAGTEMLLTGPAVVIAAGQWLGEVQA